MLNTFSLDNIMFAMYGSHVCDRMDHKSTSEDTLTSTHPTQLFTLISTDPPKKAQKKKPDSHILIFKL